MKNKYEIAAATALLVVSSESVTPPEREAADKVLLKIARKLDRLDQHPMDQDIAKHLVILEHGPAAPKNQKD